MTDFDRVVSSSFAGCAVKPLLWSYLWAARFPKEFDVRFYGADTHRGPDGWFHPSTHPLWSERMLWLWHRNPELSSREPLGSQGALSVSMGKALHSFIEVCLDDLGILVGANVPACREDLRTRGELDGIVDVPVPGREGLTGWEFKTTNVFKLKDLGDLDLDAYRAAWPGYWAQIQNYLLLRPDLWGFSTIFLSLGFPWEMREVLVPRDDAFIDALAAKYSRAVDDDAMPPVCDGCSIGAKQARACPMRRACPIGLATLEGS
jgi:hypothetical protein